MAAIRVLQVFTSMGRGGAESMIMNYYRKIDRNKVQFDFLVHRTNRAAFDDEIEQLGGKIYRLSPINPLFPKKYYEELRDLFSNNNQYSIIHSHLNTFSTFPLKIAQEFNIPTRIAHAHIAMNPISIRTAFKNKANSIDTIKKIIKLQLRRRIHKYSTHNFSCGEKAGKWLFGAVKNVYIMNNAIDSEKFTYDSVRSKKLKKEFKLDNSIVLGHIGRFTYQKNHKYLLTIFAEILKNNLNYKLVFIGDGPLQDRIKEEANNLGISNNILFLGVRTDIPDLLQMIDIFIFPSFYEGLPVTLIEAQAAGLKILASDAITQEVALTTNISFLPIHTNPKTWADKIIELGTVQKKNEIELIKKGNYDILENTRKIEHFYTNRNSL